MPGRNEQSSQAVISSFTRSHSNFTHQRFLEDMHASIGEGVRRVINERTANGTIELEDPQELSMRIDNLSVRYGGKSIPAVEGATFPIAKNRITAIMGPSGCGKSSLLRALNRIHEIGNDPTARVSGSVYFGDKNIYDKDVDPVVVRQYIGMVSQKPTPFAKSIYDNVAFGARHLEGKMDARVEQALKDAALWEEVKDKLKTDAQNLSGGQQQRMCIARALAVEPEVLLLDEPTSQLDPTSTYRIEDLIEGLRGEHTIVIVTHNMQQAARISDYAAFMLGDEETPGRIIEFGPSGKMFSTPQDPRTEAFLTGRVS